eukprot:1194170-Prorocentrum_minimum.AAC.2
MNGEQVPEATPAVSRPVSVTRTSTTDDRGQSSNVHFSYTTLTPSLQITFACVKSEFHMLVSSEQGADCLPVENTLNKERQVHGKRVGIREQNNELLQMLQGLDGTANPTSRQPQDNQVAITELRTKLGEVGCPMTTKAQNECSLAKGTGERGTGQLSTEVATTTCVDLNQDPDCSPCPSDQGSYYIPGDGDSDAHNIMLTTELEQLALQPLAQEPERPRR